MPDRAFLDTNVLVYVLVKDDARNVRAEELLTEGGTLSVQILNEFISVARRKMVMSWSQVAEALSAIRVLCAPPLAITVETHEAALTIAGKYGYAIYDALVIASALEAGCAILYSEDLNDGQTIDGQLTIRNPFARSSR